MCQPRRNIADVETQYYSNERQIGHLIPPEDVIGSSYEKFNGERQLEADYPFASRVDYHTLIFNSDQPKNDHYLPNFSSHAENSHNIHYQGYGYGSANAFKESSHIMENDFPLVDDDAVEHKHNERQGQRDFFENECSLRAATGFRLHKIQIKKSLEVDNIYECESFCFTTKQFNCLSYSFRYTSTLKADNCYLSDKSFRQLNFYTDVQPDRNFDVYTMNNQKKCEERIASARDNSDCFWHTRSGQRLDSSISRDNINVNSIVDCEVACLRSIKFTCRAFSFRFGSPSIQGTTENCQLTDWPFLEIDPKIHLVSESGFEVYERGSFGHGCEPNHFNMKLHNPDRFGAKTDQLCYVGYLTPAQLTPQSIKKSIFVNTEFDCKIECSKLRHSTLFQCMSFSFRRGNLHRNTNCDLSDILQRDLLAEVDYNIDEDARLFAWDNYNPDCIGLIRRNAGKDSMDEHITYDTYLSLSGSQAYDPIFAMETWKLFSVNGWPCRRGTICRENKIAGFWFCELEGGDLNQWDYCCRPDHQCGYSERFNYQWCYVGPEFTQWRKCSERYFPYIAHTSTDRVRPYFKPYIKDDKIDTTYSTPVFEYPRIPDRDFPVFVTTDDVHAPNFRPLRPPAPLSPPHRRPSLNDYESAFNSEFLAPPKPGGFMQHPRFWPVSYLHHTLPPNASKEFQPTFDRINSSRKNPSADSKISALENLIAVIRSNEQKNIQFDIRNDSKTNEILFVKIPLPTLNESKPNISEKVVVPLPSKINTTQVQNAPPISSSTERTADSTTPDALPETSSISNTLTPRLKSNEIKGRLRESMDLGWSDVEDSRTIVSRASQYRRGIVERTNGTRYTRKNSKHKTV